MPEDVTPSHEEPSAQASSPPSGEEAAMTDEVLRRAAWIEQEFGLDVEEALSLWEETGAQPKGMDSAPWVSVAFVFARRLRDHWR